MFMFSVSHKERVVNLGSLVGKLQSGTGVLTGFKEDKRNKALPGKLFSLSVSTVDIGSCV